METGDRSPNAVADEHDLRLVRRVLAGDRRAFEPLVREHERRVYRVAFAVLGNAEDADEVVQDVFVRAFRHLSQFRGESRFTTWLTRIAVNEAIRKRTARKDHVPLPQEGSAEAPFTPRRCESWQSDPEQLYGKQEIRRVVEGAVQSLPEIYREVFVLRDIEGFRAEEAAGVLGLSLPALKSRLLRARLMVREALSENLEKQSPLPAKIMHKAVDAGAMVAMRVMRVMGR
jgi:RNA polymerase sigma-70 factor, ECF subfamily